MPYILRLCLKLYYTFSQHQKCVEFLIIEVYRYLVELSPLIMNDIFKLRKIIYNLRNFYLFESQNPRTKWFGLDYIAYRASQIWQTVRTEMRDSILPKIFKHKVKTWYCNLFPCYYCKPYIHQLRLFKCNLYILYFFWWLHFCHNIGSF